LGVAGLPVLDDAIAHVACEVERVIEAGDHTIYLGRVVEATCRDEIGWPLLYFRRRYLRIERAATADLRGKADRLR
jgi:flavin reductase (DIM6/NTAB) family NADH-FMN oxidoreductase RutF